MDGGGHWCGYVVDQSRNGKEKGVDMKRMNVDMCGWGRG